MKTSENQRFIGQKRIKENFHNSISISKEFQNSMKNFYAYTHGLNIMTLALKSMLGAINVNLNGITYQKMRHQLILFFPMFPFDPPENIRKPFVF